MPGFGTQVAPGLLPGRGDDTVLVLLGVGVRAGGWAEKGLLVAHGLE